MAWISCSRSWRGGSRFLKRVGRAWPRQPTRFCPILKASWAIVMGLGFLCLARMEVLTAMFVDGFVGYAVRSQNRSGRDFDVRNLDQEMESCL